MAEAIVSIVVGRLTDLLTDEAQLLHGKVRHKIEQVVTKLMWMKTFLQDADSRINEYKVRKLVADIRELAYDSEHVVETFLLNASSSGKTIQCINTKKFSRKIKDVEKKMSRLSNCFRDYDIRSTLESPGSSSSSHGTTGKLKRFYSFPVVKPEIFVGFHEDVDLLVGHLVNESDDCYPLVSICGMGGLGKTTLAQKIYHHSTIKTYFAGLAWVSISRKWQTKLVLQRILVSLVPEKKNEILMMEDEKLVENLLQIQQRKKCLIVLDDIWSTDVWDCLKAAFTAEKSVSKLMLTSRKVDVLEHFNPKGFIHRPVLLSAEQSWELLRLKALSSGDYLDITRDVKRMEKLGRELVKHCFGLPLAIVILAGILITKPSLIEWEKVYDDSLLSLKRGKGLGEDYQRELFEVLEWSYNDLPPQLKPCFLYLGKFSEDAWIETETLYQLWIAEGMILSSDKKEGETMLEVAESYMGELVYKSMVQVRYNDVDSSFTKFKSCSLHDLVRDLTLSQAKVEDFFQVTDIRKGNNFHLKSSIDSKFAYTRQLLVYFDNGYTSKEANSYFLKQVNHQLYRSILLINDFPTSLPPILGSSVANFRLLRVLSLEDVQFNRQTVSGILSSISIGRVLANLVYLRYLSVRYTNLLFFPSIQKLVLLQTLKLDMLNSIYFPPWLSSNILGKLRRLQHLFLPHRQVQRRNSKLRFDELSRLETLENFDTRWCEVKDIPKLISLQRLKLKVTGSYHDVEEMMKYLSDLALSSSSCLKYLSLSLTLGMHDAGLRNNPDSLRKLLQNHDYHLQNLRICCQLPELTQLFDQQQKQLHCIHIDASSIRITRLSLWGSHLEEDPMPVLEKIPTLCDLRLLASTFLGKEMVCSALCFPKLTVLKLWSLPNLERWKVEQGSMPILSQLEISECHKLEELPEGLMFLCSLNILVLKMPSIFCHRVRLVNGEQGIDFYKVAHVPSLQIFNID